MLHASVKYKDLSYLIGEPLIYGGGLPIEESPDGRVEITEEYRNTVLLEMTYGKGLWKSTRRILIPKAELLCGSLKLKRKRDGLQITGNVVADYICAE